MSDDDPQRRPYAELSLVLQDASRFKDMLFAGTNILNEVTLEADEEGIHLHALEGGAVAMVNMFIPATLFDEYELKGEGVVTYTRSELGKYLNQIGKGEILLFDTKPDRERIILRIQQAGKLSYRKFEQQQLEPILPVVPSPKIKLTADTTIKLAPLYDAIVDARMVSEYIRINSLKESFEVYGEGDIGSAYNTWEKTADDVSEHRVDEEARAAYNAVMISDITGPCRSVAEKVKVSISTDMPIKFDYDINFNGTQNLSKVKQKPQLDFYMAPMIAG